MTRRPPAQPTADPTQGAVLFKDGFGTRVADPVDGDTIERLVLVPELAFQESALRDRVSRLSNFRHVRFPRVRSVDVHGTGQGRVVSVSSDRTHGVRVIELLHAAEQGKLTIDVNAALQVAREILPALAVLHDSRNVTHGTIGPERLLITPLGRVMFADHVLALAVEKLQYPRTRLWKEFRIAVPPSAGLPRLDARVDVSQVALTVFALVLGRPFTLKEFPDGLKTLLQQASERLSATGTPRPLSVSLRLWFERAMPIESRKPFTTALDAQVALEDTIKRERGYTPGTGAIRTLLDRYRAATNTGGSVAGRDATPLTTGKPGSAGAKAATPLTVVGGRPGERAVAGPGGSRPNLRVVGRQTPTHDEDAEEIRRLEAELERLRLEGETTENAPADPLAAAPDEPPAPGIAMDSGSLEPGEPSADAQAAAEAALMPEGATPVVMQSEIEVGGGKSNVAMAPTPRLVDPDPAHDHEPVLTIDLDDLTIDVDTVESGVGAVASDEEIIELPATLGNTAVSIGVVDDSEPDLTIVDLAALDALDPGDDDELAPVIALIETGDAETIAEAPVIAVGAPPGAGAGADGLVEVGQLVALDGTIAADVWQLTAPALDELAPASEEDAPGESDVGRLDDFTLALDFQREPEPDVAGPAEPDLPADDARARIAARAREAACLAGGISVRDAIRLGLLLANPASPGPVGSAPFGRGRRAGTTGASAISDEPIAALAADAMPVACGLTAGGVETTLSRAIRTATPLSLVDPGLSGMHQSRHETAPALSARATPVPSALMLRTPDAIDQSRDRVEDGEPGGEEAAAILARANLEEVEAIEPAFHPNPAFVLTTEQPPACEPADYNAVTDSEPVPADRSEAFLSDVMAAGVHVDATGVSQLEPISDLVASQARVPTLDDLASVEEVGEKPDYTDSATPQVHDGAVLTVIPSTGGIPDSQELHGRVERPAPDAALPADLVQESDATRPVIAPAAIVGDATADVDAAVEASRAPAAGGTNVGGLATADEGRAVAANGGKEPEATLIDLAALGFGEFAAPPADTAVSDLIGREVDEHHALRAGEQSLTEPGRRQSVEDGEAKDRTTAEEPFFLRDFDGTQPEHDGGETRPGEASLVAEMPAGTLAEEADTARVGEHEDVPLDVSASAAEKPAGTLGAEPDTALAVESDEDVPLPDMVVSPVPAQTPQPAPLEQSEAALVVEPSENWLSPDTAILAEPEAGIPPELPTSITEPTGSDPVADVPVGVDEDRPAASGTTGTVFEGTQHEGAIAALDEFLRIPPDHGWPAEPLQGSAENVPIVAPVTDVFAPPPRVEAALIPAQATGATGGDIAASPATPMVEPLVSRSDLPVPDSPVSDTQHGSVDEPEPDELVARAGEGVADSLEDADQVPGSLPTAESSGTAAKRRSRRRRSKKARQARAVSSPPEATPDAPPLAPVVASWQQGGEPGPAPAPSLGGVEEVSVPPIAPWQRRADTNATPTPADSSAAPEAGTAATVAPWLRGKTADQSSVATPLDDWGSDFGEVITNAESMAEMARVGGADAPNAEVWSLGDRRGQSPAGPPSQDRELMPFAATVAPQVVPLPRAPKEAREPAATRIVLPEAPSGSSWSRRIAVAAAVLLIASAAIAATYWYLRSGHTGRLLVSATVAGIEVSVDGKPAGKTPVSLDLAPGRHAIEMRGHGVVKSLAVEISPGVQTTERVDWPRGEKSGRIKVTSKPAGARVMMGIEIKGVTPVTIDNVPIGTHEVVLESDKGSVRSTVKVEADETAELDVQIYAGFLAVFAPVELRIFEGGRMLGTTLDGRIMLPPGSHTIRIANPALGYDESRVVEIRPGRVTAVSIEAPTGMLLVDAPGGTEVIVDGDVKATTPVDGVAVAAGTHDVVLRHPQIGQRRFVVTVGVKAPARVSFMAPQ